MIAKKSGLSLSMCVILLSLIAIVALLLLNGAQEAAAAINQVVWNKQFGDLGQDDFAVRTATDKFGNVYVVGETLGFLSGSAGGASPKGFVRKYSWDGQALWTKHIQGGGPSTASGVSVDSDGNVYIVGQVERALFGQESNGNKDAFLRKYMPNGLIKWTRQFGARGDDEAIGVSVGPGGGVYVVGETRGALPRQTALGGDDAFIRKYSPGGGIFWTRQFGSDGDDHAIDVDVGSAGKVFVVGGTQGALPRQTANSGSDAFVRKYSPRGGIYWTRQFGRAVDEEAFSTAVDSRGNVFVVGTSGIDGFVRKFSPNGVSSWNRFSSRYLNIGADVDRDNNLYSVGVYLDVVDQSSNAFVRKYAPNGQILWGRHVQGGMAFGAATNKNNKLYVVGSGPAGSDDDAFIAKFD